MSSFYLAGFRAGKKLRSKGKKAWRAGVRLVKKGAKKASKLAKKGAKAGSKAGKKLGKTLAKKAKTALKKSKKKDVDKGAKKRIAELKKFKTVQISVGVHETEGREMHQDPKEALGAATISEVAAWNEYGVPGRIPARPFVSGWLVAKRPGIKELMKRLAAGVAAGKYTAEEAAERGGSAFVGGMKQRIADGIAPANAPATIAAKGGKATPLINTGQLRSSITYEIKFGETKIRGNESGRR